MNIFDVIIFLGLIIFGLGIVNIVYQLKKGDLTRKRRIRLIITLIVVIISETTLIYGSFIEPQRIIINQQNFTLSDTNHSAVRVAFIADLHLGPYKQNVWVKKICQKLDSQKPDLVLLGGDFITAPGYSKTKKDYAKYLNALECVSKKYPTYAVMGNHEYNIGNPYDFKNYYNQADKIRKILEENNIKILDNENILFEKQNKKFWLIGVDEVWAAKSHLTSALKNTNNNYPKILLAHNPDIFHEIKKEDDIKLALCGHTHAGQIQLPFLGSLVEPPSDLGRSCYEGFCQLENTTMFITRGIGETGPRARLFAPPEIAILELYF